MMVPGGWKDAVLTYTTDDDLTPEVDLGATFNYLLVLVPTITSSTVTVHVSDVSGGTFYPLHRIVSTGNAASITSYAEATTQAVTSVAVIFFIGAAQFIKIACGTGQAASHTFKVRGFNL
jgi:hypothetical protein